MPEPPELYKPYPQSTEPSVESSTSYMEDLKRMMGNLLQMAQQPIGQRPSEEFEALTWLRNNLNESPLAGNRFDGKEEALAFVQQLYNLGAEKVYATMIWDEEWRIEQNGGAYATGLKVCLNSEQKGIEALTAIFMEELENEGVLENEEFLQTLEKNNGQLFENGVFDMWWD